jgi:hypothetical protein
VKYLSGVEHPVTRRLQPLGCGLMLNPASGTTRARMDGYQFAVDNGCYQPSDPAKAQDPDRVAQWLCWMATLPTEGRMFAVAPDVYADAEATWEWSDWWLEAIRWLGWPVALVAQNGAEDHAPMWDEIERWDVLFVGGDTDWKLSSDAADCIREAQLHDKWIHVGRVNTLRRWRWCLDLGVDSVDGTLLAYGPDIHGRKLARWLTMERQPQMWDPVPFTDAEHEAFLRWVETKRTTAASDGTVEM